MSPDYTQPERDIAADVVRLRLLRCGAAFSHRWEYVQALSEAFGAAGFKARLAEYDLACNCTACGESGRCPGVHIVGRIHTPRQLATQQTLMMGLPLWGAA